MNPIARIFQLDDLLLNNRFVSMSRMERELEVEKTTVKRDIELMRSMFAPIKYSRDGGGYYLDKSDPMFQRYKLPGLWFNAQEIHALLTLERYFEDVSPILVKQIKPLRDKLKELVKGSKYNDKSFAEKVKIIHLARRAPRNAEFEKVTHALLNGTRVKIRYHRRGDDTTTEREISPLRLVHYRENWYLDAWCHLKKGLRVFSVDEIEDARLVNKRAKKLAKSVHDAHVTPGYGIFSGDRVSWATLRFNEFRARWVSREEWHPLQKSSTDEQGRYTLEVPYSDDRELIMDILKYGPEVEVLAPDDLKGKVKRQLEGALSLYS